MEILQEIINQINSSVRYDLMLLVLGIGETAKKLVTTKKVKNEYKVLLATIPFVVIYSFIEEIPFAKVVLSYSLVFWLYALVIEWVFKKIKIRD